MTTTQLEKPLLDRLLLARCFYLRGRAVLRENGPFAAGFAISNFQDAAETYLRLLAEHLHCAIKENMAFNQLLDEIDRVACEPLMHRSSLIQLNKARVNFKHFGLRPVREDADKFQIDLEVFFATNAQIMFGIDFSSVSMISLVGHTRTENWLRKAEESISDNKPKETIHAVAVAFCIFRHFLAPEHQEFQLNQFHDYEHWDVRKLAESTENALDDLQEQLDLIMDGINLAEYRRFRSVTPVVTLSVAGTIHTHWPGMQRGEPTIEDAQRCIQFVTESVLLIKDNYVESDWEVRRAPGEKLRVIETTPVVVFPEDDPEVIRTTTVGEILLSYGSKREYKGHFSVFQDGEEAYISVKSVEEVKEK